jgi:hypothetical protein
MNKSETLIFELFFGRKLIVPVGANSREGCRRFLIFFALPATPVSSDSSNGIDANPADDVFYLFRMKDS